MTSSVELSVKIDVYYAEDFDYSQSLKIGIVRMGDEEVFRQSYDFCYEDYYVKDLVVNEFARILKKILDREMNSAEV